MSNKVANMSDYKKNKKKRLTIEVLTNLILEEVLNSRSLFVYEIEKGILLPCFYDQETLEVDLCQGEHVRSFIKNLSEELYEEHKDTYSNPDMFSLTSSNTTSVYHTIMLSLKLRRFEKIREYAFKSEDVFTFCRIPFDPCKEIQPTPTWDDLLSSFSNTEGLKAWVGSLFYSDSDRSQYLWLYGKGRNGKSTMARVISKLLGRFVASVNAPEGESARKHFTCSLLGKRLAVFDDFKIGKGADNFMRSGLFKSITGGYKVPVEKKFQMAYDTELNCKFLFTANSKPKVSMEISDQRRLIFCEAAQRDIVHNPQFEPMLVKELPEFISNCMLIYKATCPNNEPIKCDMEQATKVAEEYTEYEEAFINDHYLINKDKYVTVSEFVSVLARSGSKIGKSSLYDYLEGIGIVRTTLKEAGIMKKVLKGLALKYSYNI